jgi:FtsP/CotA-like multicopper oxidase with cupredoxin domain
MRATTHSFPTDTTGLPECQAPETVTLGDGDAYRLRIGPVVKQLGEMRLRMLAFNGSIPGPTLRVAQGSELDVEVENQGDLEATVHWHGLRLENRYDGTHETQRPIGVGERFRYRLQFPDPGVYWYHPHIRQDYGQEMGLYGNIVVVPSQADYWPPAHREVVLTLDDLLVEDGTIAPFSPAETTFAAMGRFGNRLLVGGEEHLRLHAAAGEVVRFYLTNTANTRVFDVGFRGAQMKLVGGDSGRCEHEQLVDSVVLAPSERVVVDVLFDRDAVLEHRTPHLTYELGTVTVGGQTASPGPTAAFATLRTNPELVAERERVALHRHREPDRTLGFVAELDFGDASGGTSFTCPMHPHVVSEEPGRCPECGMKLMPATATADEHGEHAHHDHDNAAGGIEWEDDMVEVNRSTTPANTRWKLVDRSTGAENQGIDWRLTVGDQVKIRLVNEMDSDHPMHHPFHIHGAGRFLVLARDGVEDPNLVWTDTVLVRTAEVVDILLDVTHVGRWMAHCHIAEHHESGMMFSFDVVPAPGAEQAG